MSDYAKATWVGSPNFSPGRDGHNPDWTAADPNTWIVMHTMVGTEAAARARFENPAQQASSNYGVCLDGSVVQYVHEDDAAWANGSYSANPGSNLDSISIEHEDAGDYNGPRTPALYEASAQLLADIHRRRGIPLVHRGDGGGVLLHREVNGASTACPDSLDVARIVARANEILNPPAPKPVPAPPDTRPEWQRNLKQLASVQTFALQADVQVLDLANGTLRGTVAKGTNLQVAFETTVAGAAYWVTTFGSTHGDGLLKADVAAAVVPPAPIYAAFGRGREVAIASGTDFPTVVAAAQLWQDANRGEGAEVLKDGAHFQTLDPIPPAPTPAPQPAPVPTPPTDLWPWLQRLLDYLRKLFGGGQ